jgi:Arc/MetJ family transcription regulator
MGARLDIDNNLLRRALRATGLPTRKAVIEEGLRMLVRLHRQRAILALGGKVAWGSKSRVALAVSELSNAETNLIKSARIPAKHRYSLKVIK